MSGPLHSLPWHPITVDRLRELLGAAPARWWLSGGEAIDAFVGRHTREHGDLDISVVAASRDEVLAALPWPAFAAGVLGDLVPFEQAPWAHNIWLGSDGEWVLQVNVEDGNETEWRYRRFPDIRVTWNDAIWNDDGIAVTRPEIQLLWKSKAPVQKDLDDASIVFPLLDSARREWLAQAIAAAHPGSPLLDGLL